MQFQSSDGPQDMSSSELQALKVDKTLNIANVAVLFCQSEDINFLMPEDAELSEEECSALIEDVISISEMSLDVKVRFVWPSTIPHMTKSRITNASIDFYGTDCCKYFTSKSVSFTAAISESTIYSEDYLFHIQAQRMIDALSYVPPPPTIHSPSDLESPGDFESSCSENELYETSHQCAHYALNFKQRKFGEADVSINTTEKVIKFCRNSMLRTDPIFPKVLPVEIFQLILMMYILPHKFKVTMPEQRVGMATDSKKGTVSKWTAQIWLCPGCLNDLDTVKGMLMDIFVVSMLSILGKGDMYMRIAEETDWKLIDTEEWKTLSWNDLERDMNDFEWRLNLDQCYIPDASGL